MQTMGLEEEQAMGLEDQTVGLKDRRWVWKIKIKSERRTEEESVAAEASYDAGDCSDHLAPVGQRGES